MAMKKHAEVTLSTNAYMVFDNIPQDGKDLLMLVSARSPDATGLVTMGARFNDDSSNFNWLWFQGTGSVSSSSTSTSFFNPAVIPGTDATANTYGFTQIYVTNYSSTTLTKAVSITSATENSGNPAYMRAATGLYNTTAAITRLDPYRFMASGSTASLYIIS